MKITTVNDRTQGIPITVALIVNIALLTIVIGALCAWLVTSMGTEDIRRQERAHLAETANNIANSLSQAMVEREVEIRTIRDLFERELVTATAAQKREIMERTQSRRRHFSWLGVVGGDGTIRIGTGGLLEGVGISGRSWFEGARQAPVYFGNIHPAKLLEAHVSNPDGAPLYLLDIALPLHDENGGVNGVLGSHFNWRMIEEVVKLTLGESHEAARLAATVVGAQGEILYDTKGATGNVDSLLRPLKPGEMIESTWPTETESSFLATAPAPASGVFNGLGWRVVVRESVPAVSAGITRMRWQVIGVSIVVGLLFSLLALFVVRPVVRPLRDLVDNLDRFGKTGALPALVHDGKIAEIRNLRDAFKAMAARVSAHQEMLRETQFEIVRTLGRAGEFRDNETGNHVFRMSKCCAHLAALAGRTAEEVEMLRLASQMHDIGKIGISDQVLLKPGRFDDEERAIMERHCEIGARILSGVEAPLTIMARTIALTHHEKWDGTGYPNGLAGDSIPWEGRISSICDVFDALLSSRPYKQGWPLERTAAYLREQAGCQFDPALVSLFLDHVEDFVAIRTEYIDESENSEGTLLNEGVEA